MSEGIKHVLVPIHIVLSDSEKEELLKKYSLNSLPKIKRKDPAILSLNLEPNTVIKIERKFRSFKEVYYRVVSNE
ncbi:MAG: DNA-directed RNA polymerase subunit RpoH/Rpb5 C-terminal domain-containing protein [Candidatus Nanoarchaeia archaeon]|nr:DNA-directed RNA polymerase subunit RpoH/Rpb5 C-terminal domain-containing protein [Candidatus Nanoarchaeia archaeon]